MKDITLIPEGLYCYKPIKSHTGWLEVTTCPYWSRDEERDDQENGYCSFMEKGDWEMEGLGLLWDGVKECGENLDEDEE